MNTQLVPIAPAAEASLKAATEAAASFIAASQADNTRRAYAADWRDFERWCAAHGCSALPAAPVTVASYLGALATAGRRFATVKRRCAAIAHFHVRARLDNPVAHAGVKATLAGIARKLGSAPNKKAALTADLVARAARRIAIERADARGRAVADLAGLRDRALILLGFAGALRRSELVALDVADVGRHPKGIVVTIRRSKTDQAGAGRTKAIPHGRRLQAVAALDAWLAAAQITEGPLFRGVRGTRVLAGRLSDRQVARIVKARAAAIGLDPHGFAGHSLRSGYITSAAEHGASLTSIAEHAGHAKVETTAGYVQVADAFRGHSGKGFL